MGEHPRPPREETVDVQMGGFVELTQELASEATATSAEAEKLIESLDRIGSMIQSLHESVLDREHSISPREKQAAITQVNALTRAGSQIQGRLFELNRKLAESR